MHRKQDVNCLTCKKMEQSERLDSFSWYIERLSWDRWLPLIILDEDSGF